MDFKRENKSVKKIIVGAQIKSRPGKLNDRGMAAIIILLMIMGLVLIITLSVSTVIFTKKQLSRNYLASEQSYYSAESGIEDAVLRVLKNYNYTAINNFTLDGASISQDINQVGDILNITSSSNYSNNSRKLASSLTITTTNVSFYYGVQVGQGGLTMGNNSQVTGNIYSDGTITGSGTITGDAFVATGMQLDSAGDWENYSNDSIFGQNNPDIDIAMKFIPTSSANLSQVAFYLKRTSGIPSDGVIRITKDVSGSPSNQLSDQLASTTFTASKIGTTYGWVSYSFSSPANLTSGTPYWILIDISQNNSKYFYIGRSASNTDISKYSSNWSSSPWATDASGGYEYKAWMGGLPTSLNNVTIGGNAHANTITSSTIAKDAYYQTISGSTVGGISHPGSPDPAVVAMPLSASNVTDWENSALAGGVYSDAAHCSPTTDITIGPARLDCDFTPTNGIKVTLAGTLWINGNMNASNNAIIQLASGYGGNSGEIIVDKPSDVVNSGTITVSNNVNICGSQGYNSGANACYPSNGSYILFLSTNTSTNAISVANNATGAIFYASNGTANISNGANLKEVTAYRLSLANNAIVTYETGLASAVFSTGPGAGWLVNSWNEIQ